MKRFKSVDAVLDFAIEREEEAAQTYLKLAKSSKRPGMKGLFEQFALEEKGHRAKLQGIKEGKLMLAAKKKVADLMIGDYLVEVEASGDLDYQQALIFAMKKEKAAFKLYHALAAQMDDPGLKQIFLGLAQEEAKHKLRFEIEYDDVVMAEN